MRILFISPHKEFGGSSTANRQIAKMLKSLGHDVIYNDEYNKDDDPIVNSYFPFQENRFFYHLASYKFIKRNKPDCIIVGVPFLGLFYFFFFLLLRLFGYKIIFIFHSLSLKGDRKDKIKDFIVSLVSVAAKELVFVSEYTKKSWSKYWCIRNRENHLNVIYNAIPKRIHNGISDLTNNKRVIFVGRLSEEKQPDIFCEVARQMKQSGFEFVIYGDGPMMDELKSKYIDEVVFIGFERNIGVIYSEGGILLMTSKFENCPMAIIEARNYGIPCVAPSVGGIPEITSSNNGLLYDSFDLNLIAQKVLEISNNYLLFQDACLKSRSVFYEENIRNQWEKLVVNCSD